MALDLAGGMSTTEAAKKYDLSPGRISQFRREFKELFDEFMAE
jgi:transposase